MALTTARPRGAARRFRGRYDGVALLASALLTLGLAGCGGGAASQSAPPIPSESPMSTSPTPSVSSSAPAKPQSPFEHDAPVKAVRAFAVALGHAVNHHDTSMKSLGRWTTAQGRQLTAQAVEDDLKHHYTWPGPQPFTPVHVAQSGDTATVVTCWQSGGWSLDASGGRVHKRAITPVQVRLIKSDGSWKVDAIYTADADCHGVQVEGVRW